MLLLALVLVPLVVVQLASAGQTNPVAVNAVNALGIDLLHQTAQPGVNALLSPYSIQLALVMTCAGADGQTRDEMVRVLHYPKDEDWLNHSFAALQTNVNGIMSRDFLSTQKEFEIFTNFVINNWRKETIDQALAEQRLGFTNNLLTLTTVNRLYGQNGYDFRPAYLKLLADNWQAPFEPVDFHNAPAVTAQINSWVQDQTHDRIKNLIPADALNENSRLVLVNAIYLKARWLHSFSAEITKPGAFHLSDGTVLQVPTMSQPHTENVFIGYARRGDLLSSSYTIIALPYKCPELQFVILLPDQFSGLPALEARLTPELLTDCTNLPLREADLSLPKFKIEPPPLSLVEGLQTLGMKSAFIKGIANFNRTALPRSGEPLYISGIFHQTFLQLDESGTEAAAGSGTARGTYGTDTNVPVQVKIDRPFLFMIQHQPTGACLFLGRVTDPR